nr:bifunctional dihydrofolate reductase-thymidylate synthase-like [Ipomoea batatas]
MPRGDKTLVFSSMAFELGATSILRKTSLAVNLRPFGRPRSRPSNHQWRRRKEKASTSRPRSPPKIRRRWPSEKKKKWSKGKQKEKVKTTMVLSSTRPPTEKLLSEAPRYSLSPLRPIRTVQKVFWRGVVEELLWFISGSTNAKVLQEKGIHIWDGNASRDYLDSIGLEDREEGDLGPIYGFQWRHFGARYTNMHADYTGQGFDQLLDVINKIKNNPNDRRIVLSAWNPSDLKLMALPPCHMFAQFYVANGELSCQMYQRSADMGLGVPFNIASYSLLTCMIAHVSGLVPGEFVHVIGDAHVYRTHVRPLQDQLQKLPRPFPILKINPEKQDIESFVAADFKLIGYDPHQKIEMKMAV